MMLCLRLMQHLSRRLQRWLLTSLRWWLKWTLRRLMLQRRLYEFLQYFDTQAQCLLRFRLQLEPSERRLLQFLRQLERFEHRFRLMQLRQLMLLLRRRKLVLCFQLLR
jgi:hypothetical protein